jgi:hypothetical protein
MADTNHLTTLRKTSSFGTMRNKIAIGVVMLLLSVMLSVGITMRMGDRWEEPVRRLYYRAALHTGPPASGEIVPDSLGVPCVHYAAYGPVPAQQQYNPTIVAMYAIHYDSLIREQRDTAAAAAFAHCIRWLGRHISYRDGRGQYVFGWQQPFYPGIGVPWYSGLASGRAIEALTLAWQQTHDSLYLTGARALMRGFYVPAEDSSFTLRGQDGWWYEEYSGLKPRSPHVLNGHIYALLGLHAYWVQTHDDSAAFLFQQGIRALVSRLPDYDRGDGWSYYDFWYKPADNQYQRNIVYLMERLYAGTGNPVFRRYAQKWKAPLNRPYLLRVIRERNRSGMLLIAGIALICFVFLSAICRTISAVRDSS